MGLLLHGAIRKQEVLQFCGRAAAQCAAAAGPENAFAALLSDGSVLTWGGYEEGGLNPQYDPEP